MDRESMLSRRHFAENRIGGGVAKDKRTIGVDASEEVVTLKPVLCSDEWWKIGGQGVPRCGQRTNGVKR